MTLLDDLERLHAEASTVGFQSPDAATTRARWIADVRNVAPRLLAMLRAAEGMREALAEIGVRNQEALLGKLCDDDWGRVEDCSPAQSNELAAALEASSAALSAYDAAKGEWDAAAKQETFMAKQLTVADILAEMPPIERPRNISEGGAAVWNGVLEATLTLSLKDGAPELRMEINGQAWVFDPEDLRTAKDWARAARDAKMHAYYLGKQNDIPDMERD